MFRWWFHCYPCNFLFMTFKAKISWSFIVTSSADKNLFPICLIDVLETQQEKISRILWNLCKNWNIKISPNQGGTNSTSTKKIGKDLHHTIMLPRNCNWSMYRKSCTGNCDDNHDELKTKTKENYTMLKLNIKQRAAEASSSETTKFNSKTSDKDVIIEM